MYFYIISTILFGLALGAPQDLLTQSSDEVPVYEDGYRTLTEEPQSYATDKPYEPMFPTIEYEPKEPEYPAPVEYEVKEPEYMPPVIEYVPKEEEYATESPYYAPPVDGYEAKKPEYSTEEPEPTVVFELATESSPSTSTESDPEERSFHKQTIILNSGKHLSEAITAKIVGPVILFNSKVAAAAGSLPPFLAAKGAVIGSVIATPIEVGAVAGSSVVSGVTGKLVSVPISLGAGAVAKFVTAAEEGKQIWDFNVQHGGQVLKNGIIKLGHLALKPVAVVVGAKTALTGAGVGVFGTGVKSVGVGMEAIGAKMVSTGLVAKGLGHRLIAKNLPPFVK